MAFGNLKRTIQMITDTERNFRKTALTNKINGLTIDTCNSPDCGWETGIQKETWIIVEKYADKQQAIKGHKKWCKKIKENKDLEITHCRTAEEWFFGGN